MTKYIKIFLTLLVAVSISSCSVNNHIHRNLPPGKEKKVYGNKSAKKHSPGQKKKKNNNKKKGKGHGRSHHKNDAYFHF